MVLCFPVSDVFAHGGRRRLEHQGNFRRRDTPTLSIDFLANPGDGIALDVAQACAVSALGSFVFGHEGDDHGHQSGFA